MDEVITLLKVQRKPGAEKDLKEEIIAEREVFAEKRSIGMKEFYEGFAKGLKPELTFRLSDNLEYEGERDLLYNGVRYHVLRTFLKDDRLELVVKR